MLDPPVWQLSLTDRSYWFGLSAECIEWLGGMGRGLTWGPLHWGLTEDRFGVFNHIQLLDLQWLSPPPPFVPRINVYRAILKLSAEHKKKKNSKKKWTPAFWIIYRKKCNSFSPFFHFPVSGVQITQKLKSFKCFKFLESVSFCFYQVWFSPWFLQDGK